MCRELEVDTEGQGTREGACGYWRSVGWRWSVRAGVGGQWTEGGGRGYTSTPALSPGTAQPWAVITSHTSHFWGDTWLLWR